MMAQVQAGTVYTYDVRLSGEWPALVGGTPYTFTTRHTASGTPICGLAARMPRRLKFHRGRGKLILRETFADLLPEQ